MSRGPGRIEQVIAATFEGQPSDAYSVDDLADLVFPGANRIEKKHRVSVIRAAKNVCTRMDGWSWSWAEGLGRQIIFWNRYDVTSYGLMQAKTDMFARYRVNDPRVAPSNIGTPQSMRAVVEPGGKYHKQLIEGGTWWRHVQLWIAERDGDTSERAQALRAEDEREQAKLNRLIAAMEKGWK